MAKITGTRFNDNGTINNGSIFPRPKLVGDTLALLGDINDEIFGLEGNDVLEGRTGSDRLVGESGNDLLDGGTGQDQMLGGTGDDTYVVDSAGDVVTETAGAGTDTVKSFISFNLSNILHVEHLTLIGTARINGTGNQFRNSITGNNNNNRLAGLDGNDIISGKGGDDTLEGGDGNDTLDGDAGNDRLDGGIGADTMRGGANNDTYIVDNAGDRVLENSNQGTDLVESSIAFTLPNHVENLTLTGIANINGTGNGEKNTITGNSGRNRLQGLNGDDRLLGGGGDDTLEGGGGKDFLDGGANNDSLNGGAEDDTLEGGAGNDRLDGGAGTDIMRGGAGNDTYVVDRSTDEVSESAGAGIDTIESSVNIDALALNVEVLKLLGSATRGIGNSINNTIIGNQFSNVLHGEGGNDLLDGGSGNDDLRGGIGDDTLTGGAGDDLLFGDGLGLGGRPGRDRFAYTGTTAFRQSDFGVDTILDFTPAADQIVLSKSVFRQISSTVSPTGGFSNAAEFAVVTSDASAATSAADIVYNSANGKLFYNPNGVAGGFNLNGVGGITAEGGHFLTLVNAPALTARNFVLVS